jgi:hypothetical protein
MDTDAETDMDMNIFNGNIKKTKSDESVKIKNKKIRVSP